MCKRIEKVPGVREFRAGRHFLAMSELHFLSRSGFRKIYRASLERFQSPPSFLHNIVEYLVIVTLIWAPEKNWFTCVKLI